MPWPNVVEIEVALPHASWTLVGGLMAQLHAIHSGIDAIRPTNDVDIVLHVETTSGIAAAAASALEGLGYALAMSLDPREKTAHRFTRGDAKVDLVTSAPDVVDVLVAEHAAPRVAQTLRGHAMVAIEGGTQALRRTVNARLDISPERTTTVSVPGVFGETPHSCCAVLLILMWSAGTSRARTSSGCRPWFEACLTMPEPGEQYPPSSVATVRPHSAF
jgi:hypothetical protein